MDLPLCIAFLEANIEMTDNTALRDSRRPALREPQVPCRASDLAHGDIGGAPITAVEKRLSDYAERKVISHWHDELEIIYVDEGSMTLCVNEAEITAETGSAILIKPRRMHSVGNVQGDDCRYICILAGASAFPPLLSAHDGFTARILDGSVPSDDADFFVMPNDVCGAGNAEIRAMAERAAAICRERPEAYMMEAVGLLHVMTARICSCGAAADERRRTQKLGFAQSEAAIQREMISYICGNYHGKITLADIAEAGRVCRSRCCAIFRKYLKQPPIDFLNSYRLTVSLSMLRDTDDRISDIAAACGFTHQSYYTKMFSRRYGCTPNEARAKFRGGTAA